MTSTEGSPICPASSSVTNRMDCRNEQGRTLGLPENCRVDEPWRVEVVRCACGQEYAARHQVLRPPLGVPRCNAPVALAAGR